MKLRKVIIFEDFAGEEMKGYFHKFILKNHKKVRALIETNVGVMFEVKLEDFKFLNKPEDEILK